MQRRSSLFDSLTGGVQTGQVILVRGERIAEVGPNELSARTQPN